MPISFSISVLILEQLPRLPALILDATSQIRHLERVTDRQNNTLEHLEKQVTRLKRRDRVRRYTGTLLIVAALVLLWEPISQAIAQVIE